MCREDVVRDLCMSSSCYLYTWSACYLVHIIAGHGLQLCSDQMTPLDRNRSPGNIPPRPPAQPKTSSDDVLRSPDPTEGDPIDDGVLEVF
jgi:hypothetical protein